MADPSRKELLGEARRFVVEMVARCLEVETRVVPAEGISALGVARLAHQHLSRMAREGAA